MPLLVRPEMSTAPPALVTKRALPPLLVPVKLVVPLFSVVMVELAAVAELLKVSVPLLSISALPAVELPLKLIAPAAPTL